MWINVLICLCSQSKSVFKNLNIYQNLALWNSYIVYFLIGFRLFSLFRLKLAFIAHAARISSGTSEWVSRITHVSSSKLILCGFFLFSDSNLISFETAERPNYFLQLVSNNTLVLSKWERSEEFHNRSTFVIHKNTWLSGYSSFESFAKPGYFIHFSASSVELLRYRHSEEFRLSTLFKLVGR